MKKAFDRVSSGVKIALMAGVLVLGGCGGGGEETPPATPDSTPSTTPFPHGPSTPSPGVLVSPRPGPPGTGRHAADLSDADCRGLRSSNLRSVCVVQILPEDGEGAQIGKFLVAADLGAVLCEPLQAPEACLSLALSILRGL